MRRDSTAELERRRSRFLRSRNRFKPSSRVPLVFSLRQGLTTIHRPVAASCDPVGNLCLFRRRYLEYLGLPPRVDSFSGVTVVLCKCGVDLGIQSGCGIGSHSVEPKLIFWIKFRWTFEEKVVTSFKLVMSFLPVRRVITQLAKSSSSVRDSS